MSGTLKGEITVSGWFLDPSGISQIEILVDGKSVGLAEHGLPRLDVYNAHPAYQMTDSGYKYVLNTKNVSDGKHTLTIRATGNNGVKTDLNREIIVQNVNLPVKGSLDVPLNGSTVKGSIDVRGWFLDPSGVSKIEVLIDGKAVGEASYGQSRLDVYNAYPDYNNKNAGYIYSLNTTNLSNGKHTLTVRESGNNGGKMEYSRQITVQNVTLPVRGSIDDPKNGSTVKGSINVRGWFLDPSGVSKIEVLIDGKSVGEAAYGDPRLDVYNAYPAYNNKNAGYKYVLNTANLSNGKHTLTVRETGKNGVRTEHSRQITVQNVTLPVRGSIDDPKNGSTVKGNINVRGWFLDPSGVSKIEVLIDGKTVGEAEYGVTRLDVYNAYPEYKNSNAGYTYTLNTSNLSNGKHTLTVRETGNNGVRTDHTREINVKNQILVARGTIDEPGNGKTVKGNINVRGWFLDPSDVSKIEVLIDGKTMGEAEYGLSRPDVYKAYPEYQNPNAGYKFVLNTLNLSNGKHTLTVKETGKNGVSTEYQREINIQNLLVRGSLDEPSNGKTVKGNINVRGWFLDVSGVSKIDVLVDGRIVGQAQYGEPRKDVYSAYPEYQNPNAGYSYVLDTTTFTNGKHTVTVRETGNNGASKEYSREINVQNLPSKGSIDSPLPGTTVKGQIDIRGWFLDVSGVSKVEVFIDGKNMGQATYGGERLDVKRAYPEYGIANSGYTFSLDTTQVSDGQHTLTVIETGRNGSTLTLSNTINVMNGNPYLYLDLRKPANITVDDIINLFNQKGHPNSALKDYAQSYIDAQNKYGINAAYLVAHAIWETGWGGSNLIGYKNNLYGYGAYDPCPFTCGFYFPNVVASIDFVAYTVRDEYLTEFGDHYHGPNLVGMNVEYATDPNWKNGIANLMQSLKPFDFDYYNKVGTRPASSVAAPSYGREIPEGQPYPKDIIIKYTNDTYATVITSDLAFRELPYTSSVFLISRLTPGTVVKVLGYNTDVRENGNYPYDSRWYRVLVNGREGWVYGGGLSFNGK